MKAKPACTRATSPTAASAHGPRRPASRIAWRSLASSAGAPSSSACARAQRARAAPTRATILACSAIGATGTHIAAAFDPDSSLKVLPLASECAYRVAARRYKCKYSGRTSGVRSTKLRKPWLVHSGAAAIAQRPIGARDESTTLPTGSSRAALARSPLGVR